MPLKIKSIIGFDIGTNQIKIVKMGRDGRVNRWAVEPVPKGIIGEEGVTSKELLAGVIARVLKKHRIHGRRCSLCLSTGDIIIRQFRFPFMAEQQIKENILYEMMEYLPLDYEEYIIEYKVLEEVKTKEANTYSVMVIAVQRKLIESYISAVRMAGLSTLYIDIPANCRQKLLSTLDPGQLPIDEGFNLCIVDIGANTTKITLFHSGVYYIDNVVPFGGNDITSIIANQNGIDMLMAEKQKIEGEYLNQAIINQSTASISNYINNLIDEIWQVIQYYQNHITIGHLHGICLMGGGSLLKGLPEYMEQQMSIPVYLIDKLCNIPCRIGLDGKVVPAALFADAIGSTLREVDM